MKTRASKILSTLPVAIALVSAGQTVAAQEVIASPGIIEEVVVLGRLKSSTTDVFVERLEQEVVVDLLSAEDISRVGDSTVAAALRRVPGLTLVDNQFVYVRGLGERYSSALLDGATVPSPDFMRNVIPLDIFPTNILDSLAVQKGYSADMPAAFGGGNINIRTRNIPDGPVFEIEVGSGWNFESGNDTFTSSGGDDDWFGKDDGGRALPSAISGALQTFRGDVSTGNILQTLRFDQAATPRAGASRQSRSRDSSGCDDGYSPGRREPGRLLRHHGRQSLLLRRSRAVGSRWHGHRRLRQQLS